MDSFIESLLSQVGIASDSNTNAITTKLAIGFMCLMFIAAGLVKMINPAHAVSVLENTFIRKLFFPSCTGAVAANTNNKDSKAKKGDAASSPQYFLFGSKGLGISLSLFLRVFGFVMFTSASTFLYTSFKRLEIDGGADTALPVPLATMILLQQGSAIMLTAFLVMFNLFIHLDFQKKSGSDEKKKKEVAGGCACQNFSLVPVTSPIHMVKFVMNTCMAYGFLAISGLIQKNVLENDNNNAVGGTV